ILSGKLTQVPDSVANGSQVILRSVVAWRAGRVALSSGDAELALAQFDRAAQLVPSSTLFKIVAVFALTHLARWDEVDRRLAAVAPPGYSAPRRPAAPRPNGFCP